MRVQWIIAAAASAVACLLVGTISWPTNRCGPASDSHQSRWSEGREHPSPTASTEHATTRHDVDRADSSWGEPASSPGPQAAQPAAPLRGLLTAALSDDLKLILVAHCLKACPSSAPVEIARALEALPAGDLADELGTILETGDWHRCTAEFLHVWLTTASEDLRRSLQSSIARLVTNTDMLTLRAAYDAGDEARRALVCDLVAQVSSPEARDALLGWAAASHAA